MAIDAQVINGHVVANSTPDNTSVKKLGSSNLGVDEFLTILVAEMQYQDPLEPSSNTEWVSQMATFTQVEQVSDLSDTVTKGQLESLVGKTVIMAPTDNEGETTYVSGTIQSLEIKEDGTYFSIDGRLYSSKDLYAVVDKEYYDKLMAEIEEKK